MRLRFGSYRQNSGERCPTERREWLASMQMRHLQRDTHSQDFVQHALAAKLLLADDVTASAARSGAPDDRAGRSF